MKLEKRMYRLTAGAIALMAAVFLVLLILYTAIISYSAGAQTETMVEEVNRVNRGTIEDIDTGVFHEFIFPYVAQVVDNKLYYVQADLADMIDNRAIIEQEPTHSGNLQDYADRVYSSEAEESYLNMFIVFNDTGEYYGTRPSSIDFRGKDWYKAIAAKGETIVTKPYESAIYPGQIIFTIGAPVYENGELAAVVGLDLTSDHLFDTFSRDLPPGVQGMFFVDEDGGFFTDGSEEAKQVAEHNKEAIVEKMHGSLYKEDGSLNPDMVIEDGDYRIFVMKPPSLDNVDWGFVVVYEWTYATDLDDAVEQTLFDSTGGFVQGIVRTALVLLGVLVAVMAAAVAVVHRRANRRGKELVAPINEILNKLRKVSEGDLDQDFSAICTGDEIEIIAQSISQMEFSLKKHLQDVETNLAEKQKLNAELQVAGRIQRSLLPPATHLPAQFSGVSLYATMIPAKAVGGDFYDFYYLDETHLLCLIADVSGKGISAALFMAMAKLRISNAARAREKEPGTILAAAGGALAERNSSSMFATCFLAIIDTQTGEMRYSCAGHNPPLLICADGVRELAVRRGIPLGILENAAYATDAIQLEKDCKLLLYTDGITEAFNTENEEYGLARLKEKIARMAGEMHTAAGYVQSVVADVEGFSRGAGQADDITMLLFALAPDQAADRLVLRADVPYNSPFAFVRRMMQGNGFGEDEINEVRLVFEELYVNIQHHAYDGRENGEIAVELAFREIGRKLTLRLEDGGAPFDPVQKEDPRLPHDAEDLVAGGLGIFISKNMADDLRYSREGGKNITTITKFRKEKRGGQNG